MRGYPKVVLQKKDFLNLLAMKEHKKQALSDLQKLHANDDTLIMTTTSQIDTTNEMSDWNQKMLPNPSPLWQQKGFKSREELVKIIEKNGGKV